jgi:hypothetical protein
MRTTVTLDPDVESLVRKAMRERDSSFKAVVNDAIRAGLGERRPSGRHRRPRTPTFNMGTPSVPLDKALQLVAVLEDEELARRLAVRK